MEQQQGTAKKLNANVEAIQHTDIRGSQLKYIRITSNGKEVLINCGDKTYSGVKEALEPKQELPPITDEQLKKVVEEGSKNKPKGGKE